LPAVILTTFSPPSVLTPRQIKRQLRAAAFKTRKSSDSPEAPMIRKSTQIARKRPADPKYNNFFQYLDLVDSGVIRIPETSPISPKSNFNTTLFPSIRKTCASSPISLWLPRRPPVSLLPKILESNHAKSRSFVLPTIRQPTWSLVWPKNYSTVFKLFSSQYFSSRGYIFEKSLSLTDIQTKVNNCDDTVSISEFFHYSLISCSITFCNNHLHCCTLCGLPNDVCDDSPLCWKYCSDCSVPHRFFACPKLHLWLHDPTSPYHSAWMDIVRNHLSTTYVPTFGFRTN